MMSQLRCVALSCLVSGFQTFFFGQAIVSEVRDGNEGTATHSKIVFLGCLNTRESVGMGLLRKLQWTLQMQAHLSCQCRSSGCS